MLRQSPVCRHLLWEGDQYIPLTIIGSCDYIVLAVWLSFTLPLYGGGNCLELVAVVPVNIWGGGLNCKPLVGSVVTESACVVIMGQGCYPFEFVCCHRVEGRGKLIMLFRQLLQQFISSQSGKLGRCALSLPGECSRVRSASLAVLTRCMGCQEV